MRTSTKLILGLTGVLALSYLLLKPTEKEELARVMYAEAANQPRVVRRLVGETVMNRVQNREYPSTVRGVIHQDNAFSSVGRRLWNQTALPAWIGYSGNMNVNERKIFDECLRDASALMSGENIGLAGEDRIEAFYSGKKPSEKYWRNMQTLYSNGKMSFCGRR